MHHYSIIKATVSLSLHLLGLRFCVLGLTWTHYVIKSLWAGEIIPVIGATLGTT